MKLPIRGSDIWPSGKLLQLEKLNPGEIKRLSIGHSFIIQMTFDEFAIVEIPLSREENLTPSQLELEYFNRRIYNFYSGPEKKVASWSTKVISKVKISTSLLTNFMCVWIRPPGERDQKILTLESPPFYLPKTLADAMDAAHEAGLLGPDEASTRRSLLVREIEREIRLAAPQAEIILQGQQLPEEVFRLVVQ